MSVFSRAAAGLTMVLAVTVSTGVDRFWALRDGDYVRVEGRFLDRQRFELATFLRDNRQRFTIGAV